MDWKNYPLRAVKYVAYFYFLGVCFYFLMRLMGGGALISAPDLQTLFTPRMMVGLALLGLCYPLFAFNVSSVQLPEGGWEKHEKNLREVLAVLRYKFQKTDDSGRRIFVADSPALRLVSMFEDTVSLELTPDGTLLVTGPRKFVVKARLKVGDYVRRDRG